MSCGLIFKKGRKLYLVNASLRFFECKQQKMILTNLSKKGEVLVRDWVAERREKRLKKQALKQERNQDREITNLSHLGPAAKMKGPVEH